MGMSSACPSPYAKKLRFQASMVGKNETAC